MVGFPNSKINLGLNVVEKRPDGYHNIETVFYPVEWCDVLEIVEEQSAFKDGYTFCATGLPIDDDFKNNLCTKAYHLLRNDFLIPRINIHLHKIIPMGAGLGGGSSNAAFTLKLLNDLFHLKLNNDELRNYANQIGSDCAFFIEDVPVFASGRGEILEKINLSLKGYFILIVKPEVHVSTVDAYKMVKPQFPKQSLKEIIQQPITEWSRNFGMKNDFEIPVFEKYPAIREIKDKMYQQGAIYASMSGSGSALYGIFEMKRFEKNAFKDCFVWEGILN